MEAGALGTETNALADGGQRVTAYFSDKIDEDVVRAMLFEAFQLYDLSPIVPPQLEVRKVANRDWLAEWKKGWQPVEVGQRFLIAPPWSEIPDAHDRLVIRIEPGMAFGTGTHETTRLCLVAIEKYFHGGTFVDVGTGTGILAIAAAKLHPGSQIGACDTDAEAVAIARDNARLNYVAESISFSVGTVAATTASADCVCANLTADTILPLLPALLSATCGRLILSGILVEQTDSIRLRLEELGIHSGYEVVTEGEWAAFII
ncbi:MAG: ribosomal protein methyltransferase [Blastocatellia bacterium]|jgi:ribosomal protein L11 methyltransferase|nr:ribosomal protein methyltransferase [Blastocatellia bacterium]